MLILILIVTSLIIRLDYMFNILNKLPYEAEFIIRICSGILVNRRRLTVTFLSLAFVHILSRLSLSSRSAVMSSSVRGDPPGRTATGAKISKSVGCGVPG